MRRRCVERCTLHVERQFLVLSSRFSVFSSRFSVLGSQSSVLSSWLNVAHHSHNTTPLHCTARRRGDAPRLQLAHRTRAGGERGSSFACSRVGTASRSCRCQRQAATPCLIVPLRRRTIALLVDAVDNLVDHAIVQPLPPLLRDRLREPWATGVLLIDEQPVVQLDVRAIARSILLRRTRDTQEK